MKYNIAEAYNYTAARTREGNGEGDDVDIQYEVGEGGGCIFDCTFLENRISSIQRYDTYSINTICTHLY